MLFVSIYLLVNRIGEERGMPVMMMMMRRIVSLLQRRFVVVGNHDPMLTGTT